MKYRILGRTGLEVSEISLGTWAFGNNVYGSVTEKEAVNTIHSGIDLGVNVFDTAPQYGTLEQDGVAELVLGKALKGKRNNIYISTKFGRNPSIANGDSQFYKSRIIASVEESLKRLQTDYIDVLFFHSPFSLSEINDDVWEGIEKVKEQGKVRFIGHSISKLKETGNLAYDWSKENKIDVVQVVLSLMNRKSEDLIERLQEFQIGVFARECLANGFLSGVFTEQTKFDPGTLNSRYSKEELRLRLEQVNTFNFLKRGDITNMTQAALRWALDQKGISTVLSGAKNALELKEAVTTCNSSPFTADELKRARMALKQNFEPA